jgi:hypothetical protein
MNLRRQSAALMLATIMTFGWVSAGHALVSGDAVQITGYLKDNSGRPVANVTVTGDDYVGDAFPAATDANGYYSMAIKSEGNYRVTVDCDELKALGYACAGPGAVTLTSGSVQLDFTVNPAAPPLLITNIFLPDGLVGTAYKLQLGVKGGRPPYRWRLIWDATNAPAGLRLNSRGLLFGTPSTNTISILKVQVTDSNASVTNKVLSLTIHSDPATDASAAPPPPAR